MEMKEKKLTVIGTVDPINVVSKLRKIWPMTDIVLVGPAKEPEKEKKEEPKKEGEAAPKKEGDQAPKEEGKKDQGEAAKKDGEKKEGGGGGDKKEGEKKDQPQPQPLPPDHHVLELVKAYKAYNPHLTTHYYVQSMEENPNACLIC